ncbi:phospholipase D family protein, partial [Acinetobacter baumannii]
ENLNKYAYKLKLDPNNNIYWQQETSKGPVIYRKEPEMKWWQKAGMKFLSWLPLEGFM